MKLFFFYYISSIWVWTLTLQLCFCQNISFNSGERLWPQVKFCFFVWFKDWNQVHCKHSFSFWERKKKRIEINQICCMALIIFIRFLFRFGWKIDDCSASTFLKVKTRWHRYNDRTWPRLLDRSWELLTSSGLFAKSSSENQIHQNQVLKLYKH